MQYSSEDLTPVKKKITVTVPLEEVEASLGAAIAMYRTSIQLDGFRKGKVPSSIIEKRFGESLYREATEELVNVHINEIVSEMKVSPVSRIDFDGGQLERGKEFVYTISFEVLPEFDVPEFDKLKAEEEEPVVEETEVNEVIERLRDSMATTVTIDKVRKPKKGEIAVLDFSTFDEKGEPVAGVTATDFNIPLGEGQTLEDFEKLIMTLKPGEEGEGPVSFPEDFLNPEFAGRTLTMKAQLKEIKERVMPELNDEFAKLAGNFDTVEALQNSIRESYTKSKTDLHRSTAQKSLLDQLLEQTDFALPETMVQGNIDAMIAELEDKLSRQGRSIETSGKSKEEYIDEFRPEAEALARGHVFLMTVAQKNDITVAEHEVDIALRQIAYQNRTDYEQMKEYYVKNNLIFVLRDRLLCDKAMDLIYEKAEIVKVAPKEEKAKKAPAKKAAPKAAKKETAAKEGDDAAEKPAKKAPAKKAAPKEEKKD